MRFSEVPIELQVHIEQLTRDKVFQQRFATDEVLDQLDALKYDPFIEYWEMQLLLHNKFRIRQIQQVKKGFFNKIKKTLYNLLGKKDSPYIQFEPMTLGLWSYLYTIKSPFVLDEEKYTTIDLDIFFYLLQTKNFSLELKDLIVKSMNYSSQVLKLTQQQAVEAIDKIFKISLRVLNMFPRLQAQKEAVFNADWITSLVTKVVQVSSYSTQELYKDISMCEVYYLFAQYCREKGSEAIFLRTEEEILAEEDLRATTLVVERLIELGHIDQSNKQYYINLIHNIGVE